MIIDELDLGAACLPILHTCTSHNPHNHLLVEWATDCMFRKLRDKSCRGSKDASLWATNVLTIHKEIRVALHQFCQCLIHSTQHRELTFFATWNILVPLRNIEQMIHYAF